LFVIWRILLTTLVTTLFEVFGHHLLHDDPEFLTRSLYLTGNKNNIKINKKLTKFETKIYL
jgi:hypothetical protein